MIENYKIEESDEVIFNREKNLWPQLSIHVWKVQDSDRKNLRERNVALADWNLQKLQWQ